MIETLNKYKISLGLVFAILSSLWAIWSYADNYFAHAVDVREITKQIVEVKKNDLDNKIFELEFKQQNTPKSFGPLDKALLERYKRQLDNLPKGN